MKFLVLGIGGDARYAYTVQALREDGCTVTEDPAEADVVILPFHATQDGVHVWGTDVVLEDVNRHTRCSSALRRPLPCAIIWKNPACGR